MIFSDQHNQSEDAPVVNICLLLVVDAAHPALEEDVAHLLACDGFLLQDDVLRVPDDHSQHVFLGLPGSYVEWRAGRAKGSREDVHPHIEPALGGKQG